MSLHKKSLRDNKIAGAAIDVLATEYTNNHPNNNLLIRYCRDHNNLIITPHIAGATRESMKMTGEIIFEKLIKKLNIL